jgi:hypothetical protein
VGGIIHSFIFDKRFSGAIQAADGLTELMEVELVLGGFCLSR